MTGGYSQTKSIACGCPSSSVIDKTEVLAGRCLSRQQCWSYDDHNTWFISSRNRWTEVFMPSTTKDLILDVNLNDIFLNLCETKQIQRKH